MADIEIQRYGTMKSNTETVKIQLCKQLQNIRCRTIFVGTYQCVGDGLRVRRCLARY